MNRTERIKFLHWSTCSLNEDRLLIYLSERLGSVKALITLLLLRFFDLFFHCLYCFHHHILFLFKFSNLAWLIIHLIFKFHPLFFLFILQHIHLFSYHLNLFLHILHAVVICSTIVGFFTFFANLRGILARMVEMSLPVRSLEFDSTIEWAINMNRKTFLLKMRQ